jgi:DNA gyrase/topoisomerase IV subunit B
VNALSRRVEVDIDRDGKRHTMSFIDGGQPHDRLEVTGDSPSEQTGTIVRFWPDGTIFDELTFRAQTLLDRLQMMAFLNRGLEIRFRDLRSEAQRKPQITPIDYDGDRSSDEVSDYVAEPEATTIAPTDDPGLNPDDVEFIVFKYDVGSSDFV